MPSSTQAAHRHDELPLIAEHDTWISVDPLLGCPASCAYCYLQPLGLTSRPPVVRATAEELIAGLLNRFGKQGPRWGGREALALPICMGNYTDQFMTSRGIEYLKTYLRLHARTFPDHPLCVVTKARLKGEDLAELDAVGHCVLVFLSQSFARDTGLDRLERGPISKPKVTLENIRLLARTSNLVPLHFWRPITSRALPDTDTACRQLEPIQRAGAVASIAIGLKCGPFLQPPNQQVRELLGGDVLPPGSQFLPPEVEHRALEAGRRLGHPVYRHTSCAVALATGCREALGTWRVPLRCHKCEPCPCPVSQRQRCDAARTSDEPPSSDLLAEIARQASIDRNGVEWSPDSHEIVVSTELDQETHTHLTHLTGFPVSAPNVRLSLAWSGDIIPTKPRKEP